MAAGHAENELAGHTENKWLGPPAPEGPMTATTYTQTHTMIFQLSAVKGLWVQDAIRGQGSSRAAVRPRCIGSGLEL